MRERSKNETPEKTHGDLPKARPHAILVVEGSLGLDVPSVPLGSLNVNRRSPTEAPVTSASGRGRVQSGLFGFSLLQGQPHGFCEL